MSTPHMFMLGRCWYVSNGSDNGLSTVRRQAIGGINDDYLSNRLIGIISEMFNDLWPRQINI